MRPLSIAVVTGLLLLVGAPLVLAEFYQHEYEAPLPQPPALPAPPVAERILPSALPTGEAIGTLEIVRLGLSGVVAEGDTDAVLDRAIGHVRDTPLPWQEGNSALAAHRDRIFRPLRGIRSGDIVRLKTPHGDFDYEVHDTLIVKPEDVWVLDPTGTTMLTLISCFPFNYIGSAPERFIVRAQRIPPAPYVLRIGKPGA